MKPFIRAVLLVTLLPSLCYGEGESEHKEPENTTVIEVLSHDLRSLLSQEMQAIQHGMMSIIPAYVSGNWKEIEAIAEKIKDSYILKQSLTENQIKELRLVLPQEFFEKDQHFHYLAGMLAHAAKSKKPELINFYISEMTESCVSCHSAFATHRFPALIPKPDPEDEHTH